MALDKSIEQPTGVYATYWRIIQTVRHYDRNEITIDVAGYLTEDDRKAGKSPITSVQLVRPLDSLPDTRDDVYPIVKATNIVEGVETNPLVGAEDLI